MYRQARLWLLRWEGGISPDEAITYGVPIQAGILSSDTSEKIRDLPLLDVAPHSPPLPSTITWDLILSDF